MKLWLLRPIEDLRPNPWNPWYDKCFGAVVAAETDEQARLLVEAGDEDQSRRTRLDMKHRVNPWLHSELSTCIELEAGTEAGQIIQDFRSA